ncbi:hypothetical protein HDE_02232 [Halotydeus destructor]|nr:hypothetical protein HDE_02232 [Halotydeus destructor]
MPSLNMESFLCFLLLALTIQCALSTPALNATQSSPGGATSPSPLISALSSPEVSTTTENGDYEDVTIVPYQYRPQVGYGRPYPIYPPSYGRGYPYYGQEHHQVYYGGHY